MSSNSFGKIFTLNTFGESHGKAIGGVIDGCPAGLKLDIDGIQSALDRRKPGQSEITTQRKESDTVEILSGVFDGKTLGSPIGFVIRNSDQKSADYDHLKDTYRPSHADYTYDAKYGHRDHRGGGRSSARETACRVVGGAIANQLLSLQNIGVFAWVDRVKDINLDQRVNEVDTTAIESNLVRCPDKDTASRMIDLIEKARNEGDSLGGSIMVLIKGVPAGLGDPVYDKLDARLAFAMMGINAVKAVEIGSGIEGSQMTGTQQNDEFVSEDGIISTASNNSGGIQGGISNGQDIWFRVTFKPTATVMKDQNTTNSKGEAIHLEGKGRHDPCVLPRAVPVVEAMASLVIADALLMNRASQV